jgi:hypothetical protein
MFNILQTRKGVYIYVSNVLEYFLSFSFFELEQMLDTFF